MANYLKNMTIMEISLVDEPACPDADVILMKRNADLVGEAVELLKMEETALDEAIALFEKRDVSDEARDDHGRWTHQAVALLQQGKDQVVQDVRGKPLKSVKFLYGQAKEAAQHVASKSGAAVRSAVAAVKTTKLTGMSAVEGGGAQFDFEHRFSSGAKLATHVQVRPEHVVGSPTRAKALDAVHRYLASTRGAQKPAFGETGKASWLRHDYDTAPIGWSPGSTSNAPASTAPYRSLFTPGANGPQSPVNQPLPERGKAESGLPTYKWQGTQKPMEAASIERRGKQIGANAWDNAGGSSYTSRQGRFIPAARPDVQQHIEHVQNWTASNGEQGVAAKRAATFSDPSQAGGAGHFTPAGDYIPAGDQSAQYRFARDYRDERQRRESPVAPLFASAPVESTLPSHITQAGPGDHAPDFAREPLARSLRLDPSEFEAVADHFSTKMPGEMSDVQRQLSSKAVDAYNNGAPHLDISEDEASHLDRSLEAKPPKSFDQKKLHERVRNFLVRKRHVRSILTQKIKG